MKVVVGMGSNLGDRMGFLRSAAEALARVTEIVAVSSVYETAPVGDVPQGAFLNAAALVHHRDVRALFEETCAIERALGRVRRERWGPRTIDLDILWAEQPVVAPELTVPHIALKDRAFAAVPLVDVLPELAADYPISKSDLAVFALPSELWPLPR